MEESDFSRRDTLALLAAGAAAAFCGTLAGCGVTKEKSALITSGVVSLGSAADFPAGKASTRFLSTYGILVVNDSGTPVAVRPACTYKPCTVTWNDKSTQFECPCHGCRFNLLGEPVKGPATRPLPALATQRTADGTVSIDLGKLYAL